MATVRDFHSKLLRPSSVNEDIRLASILADSHNMEVVRTDHEIHMNDGIVNSFRVDFLIGHIHETFDHFRETSAGSNVAAGILIKKGVEEHETGLVDGGFLGNQCNLAQHGSTLVHGEHFLQDFFSFFCVTVHDSSVL